MTGGGEFVVMMFALIALVIIVGSAVLGILTRLVRGDSPVEESREPRRRPGRRTRRHGPESDA